MWIDDILNILETEYLDTEGGKLLISLYKKFKVWKNLDISIRGSSPFSKFILDREYMDIPLSTFKQANLIDKKLNESGLMTSNPDEYQIYYTVEYLDHPLLNYQTNTDVISKNIVLTKNNIYHHIVNLIAQNNYNHKISLNIAVKISNIRIYDEYNDKEVCKIELF